MLENQTDNSEMEQAVSGLRGYVGLWVAKIQGFSAVALRGFKVSGLRAAGYECFALAMRALTRALAPSHFQVSAVHGLFQHT